MLISWYPKLYTQVKWPTVIPLSLLYVSALASQGVQLNIRYNFLAWEKSKIYYASIYCYKLIYVCT